ncbi:Uncharacterised protein [Streptococcus suis]|uniref:hypothetical protein n=1 Tax=Streptococcus suis TaxID=1307 RepID=UPI0005CE83CA|nr:hypothetical protein [Streptococcus suis]CYV04633.1 Uncharacterised protein [Streptococcus suis]
MTEAIFTLSIFAVPILTAAAVEQRKAEKERMVQEIDCILEQEKQKNFRWGMTYEKERFKQRVLNTERQQVDKEWKRYAEMVG